MGVRLIGAALAAFLVLAACSQQTPTLSKRAPEGAPAAVMDMVAAGAPEAVAASEAPAPADPSAAPSRGAPLLAYAYATELETPAGTVDPLMKRHVKACRAAGPARCNVLGARTESSDGGGYVSAQLSLRAEPRWLEAFRAGLEGQAKAAKGRLVSSSVSAEDLTRQIVDVEARLRAQKTLRDRLQALLRERPGKLADLLETERELARVQGEIDSAQLVLAFMRERVDMSTLDISYRSAPNAVTGGTFEPVRNAIAAFLSNVAQGLAGLITLVGLALPWLIVIAPAAWFARRWLARRSAAKKP
jgi:hypothetical protein